MDSDDSDFYGDEELKRDLQSRVESFDTNQWHRMNKRSTGCPQRQRNLVDESARLHNPYAGVPYAWQLTEKLDDFLARLPPATTEQSKDVPWIYVCNPYIPRLGRRPQGGSVKANEDEAPVEEGGQLELVVKGSMDRLELISSLRDKMERAGQSQAAIQKEVGKEREQAARDILAFAHSAKIRTGKWLLFCPPAEVNEMWELVVKATANNELGIAAKVAPRSPLHDQRRDRLLCIYTADFRNRADVGRVLQVLRELKLVEARSRPIYYKPDVFTYIGISHGNPWGLSASIYSSKDVFDPSSMDWEAPRVE